MNIFESKLKTEHNRVLFYNSIVKIQIIKMHSLTGLWLEPETRVCLNNVLNLPAFRIISHPEWLQPYVCATTMLYFCLITWSSPPSSTLPDHQSRPNGGRSSSVWLLDRQHPAGGIYGIYHSILGFHSMEHHQPMAALFSGSNETVRRTWC